MISSNYRITILYIMPHRFDARHASVIRTLCILMWARQHRTIAVSTLDQLMTTEIHTYIFYTPGNGDVLFSSPKCKKLKRSDCHTPKIILYMFLIVIIIDYINQSKIWDMYSGKSTRLLLVLQLYDNYILLN